MVSTILPRANTGEAVVGRGRSNSELHTHPPKPGHRAHDAAVGKPPNERHRPLARGGKDGQDGEAAQSRCAPGRPSSTTNDARVEMGLPGRVTYSTTS